MRRCQSSRSSRSLMPEWRRSHRSFERITLVDAIHRRRTEDKKKIKSDNCNVHRMDLKYRLSCYPSRKEFLFELRSDISSRYQRTRIGRRRRTVGRRGLFLSYQSSTSEIMFSERKIFSLAFIEAYSMLKVDRSYLCWFTKPPDASATDLCFVFLHKNRKNMKFKDGN